MLKFFGGLPRWLGVFLALAAAAALSIIPYLTPSLHGWKLALSIAFVAVFTVLAVGLPQLQQWQSKQESRLEVELMTEPSELTIPSCVDTDGVIDSWLKAEEAECLSSLSPRRPTRSFRDFESGSNSEASLNKVTSHELLEIADKKKSGEQLTAEEEQALAAFQAKITPLIKGFAGGFSSQALSDPDQRTPEEYRSEVGRYLTRCQDFLDKWLCSRLSHF